MKTSFQPLVRRASAAAVTSFVFASTALASFGGPEPVINGLPSGATDGQVRNTLTNIITAVLNFLALIAVIVIIIAGIRLIVSQGEDEQKDKAKKTIFYAIAGLIVVLFARVIVSLVTVYLAGQVQNAAP